MKRQFLIGLVAALLLVPAGAMADDFSCKLDGDAGFASFGNVGGVIDASILQTLGRVEGASLDCPSGTINLDVSGRGIGTGVGTLARGCSLTVSTDAGTTGCNRLDDAGVSFADDEGPSADLRIRGNPKIKQNGKKVIVKIQNNSNGGSVATEVEVRDAAGNRVARKDVRALASGETIKIKLTVRDRNGATVVVDPDNLNNDPRRGNNSKDI